MTDQQPETPPRPKYPREDMFIHGRHYGSRVSPLTTWWRDPTFSVEPAANKRPPR
jgi:hypothetical protein